MNKRGKRSFYLKRLAYTGLFAALAVVANGFGIYLPVFGVGASAQLTFSYIVCVMAGIFLGPVAGGIVGGAGDIIGWFIQPAGPFNVFITLGSILLGVIPGLIFKLKMPSIAKIFISFALIFVCCTAGLNSFGIWFYYVRGKGFFLFLAGRLATQSIVWAVNMALTAAMYYPVAKYIFKLPVEKRAKEERESESGLVSRSGDGIVGRKHL